MGKTVQKLLQRGVGDGCGGDRISVCGQVGEGTAAPPSGPGRGLRGGVADGQGQHVPVRCDGLADPGGCLVHGRRRIGRQRLAAAKPPGRFGPDLPWEPDNGLQDRSRGWRLRIELVQQTARRIGG